jgi:hypothetical protein
LACRRRHRCGSRNGVHGRRKRTGIGELDGPLVPNNGEDPWSAG